VHVLLLAVVSRE